MGVLKSQVASGQAPVESSHLPNDVHTVCEILETMRNVKLPPDPDFINKHFLTPECDDCKPEEAAEVYDSINAFEKKLESVGDKPPFHLVKPLDIPRKRVGSIKDSSQEEKVVV